MKNSLTSTFSLRALASWPVFLFVLAWGVSTNLLDRVFNPEGLYFERILAVVCGHLVMFLVIILAVSLLSPLPKIQQALLMIPLLLLVTAIRGLTVWAMLLEFGIDEPELFNYRVLGSITNIGIPLLFSSIATHRSRVYSDSRSKLLAENTRLNDLKNFGQIQIKRDAEQQLEEVRSAVQNALAMNKTGTSAETMAAISSTIDDVVRPMTDRLESSSTSLPMEHSADKTRINWLEALLGALSAKFLRPLHVAITLCLASLVFLSSSVAPLQVVYLLLIVGISSWTSLRLTKFVVGKLADLVPRGVESALLLFAVVGSGYVVGLATLVVTSRTENPTSLLYVAPFFVIGVAMLFSLGGSTQAQAEAANESRDALREKLAWEVARVSSEQRQTRRAVSALLHGKLQSGLTSALMRLKSAEGLDSESFDLVGTVVRDELQELIKSVTLKDLGGDLSVTEVFDSIEQTWQGLAQVSLDALSSSASTDVQQDSVLLANIAEIAAELAFNSIRHGMAKQIRFSIRRVTANTILLLCVDDGSLPTASGRIGMGTKLLDECALAWSRTANPDSQGTRTSVLLPFVPAKSG